MNNSPHIIGFVTINDKGQVVIPADARALIDIKAGDKMLAVVHPSKNGVILMKPDGVEKLARQMLRDINEAHDKHE